MWNCSCSRQRGSFVYLLWGLSSAVSSHLHKEHHGVAANVLAPVENLQRLLLPMNGWSVEGFFFFKRSLRGMTCSRMSRCSLVPLYMNGAVSLLIPFTHKPFEKNRFHLPTSSGLELGSSWIIYEQTAATYSERVRVPGNLHHQLQSNSLLQLAAWQLLRGGPLINPVILALNRACVQVKTQI